MNSPSSATSTDTSSRHILPADLPNAIKHLGDQELDRLLAAVIAEQKRRRRKLPASDESSRKLGTARRVIREIAVALALR